jgi:acetylornithine deacetylase/succinyl-diaminopimelate desuccinylase-like protein
MQPDVATADLMDLLAIPAASGEEAPVAEHLHATLAGLGVPEDAFVMDRTQDQSEFGGNCGNLIVRLGRPLPGAAASAPVRMLGAHMDTVPIARDARPALEESRVVNDTPRAALGGDDRAGCAILLAAARGWMAAVVAAAAIGELARDGWHGRVRRPAGEGTSNIGVLAGGSATNTVMDHLLLRCEARSHDTAFRRRIVEQYQSVFRRIAAAATNAAGRAGSVRFVPGPAYQPCRLAEDAPTVRAALAALRHCGVTPKIVTNNGGMDTNWYNAHGIPTVSLGCGQRNPHNVAEWIALDEFHAACRVAEYLATCPDPAGQE